MSDPFLASLDPALTPGFQVIDSALTPIGLLCLCRSESPDRPGQVVTEMRLDDTLLMSSLDPVSERALATRALAVYEGQERLRVLVGGLGLGYTAQAVLADPRVERLRVIDRATSVIGWFEAGDLPLSQELLADERCEVVLGDVYADLLGAGSASWDLVLVDVDHSPTRPLDPASRPFYGVAGQRRVARHLAPGGVLAVWSAEDDPGFAAVLGEVYREAFRESVRWSHAQVDEGREVEDVLFFARP